tara:strand:+ start:119 stop:421 length:303 start_codon:yes stop_codon:yes gene_type:complete
MTIKWEHFAKRRNLNLEQFKDHLSYDQFVKWCRQRNVEPVSELEFSKKTQKDQIVEHTESTLKKYRKDKLLQMAADLDIDLQGKETKKDLVKLILNNTSD